MSRKWNCDTCADTSWLLLPWDSAGFNRYLFTTYCINAEPCSRCQPDAFREFLVCYKAERAKFDAAQGLPPLLPAPEQKTLPSQQKLLPYFKSVLSQMGA